MQSRIETDEVRSRVNGSPSLDGKALEGAAPAEHAPAHADSADTGPPEFARHLAIEGVRAVDGGYSWKFDNFTRAGSPYEFNMEDARDLWNQVRCPILILYGDESWGRRFSDGLDLSPFHDYRVERISNAGHWVHHDQFEVTMAHINAFLDGPR